MSAPTYAPPVPADVLASLDADAARFARRYPAFTCHECGRRLDDEREVAHLQGWRCDRCNEPFEAARVAAVKAENAAREARRQAWIDSTDPCPSQCHYGRIYIDDPYAARNTPTDYECPTCGGRGRVEREAVGIAVGFAAGGAA